MTRPNPAIEAVLTEMHEHGIILDATLWPYETENVKSCTPEQLGYLARAAARAGVLLSAGTDDWDPRNRQSQLLNEIEWLVGKAGLSPADALKAATIIGAQTIGETDRMGTIEKGRIANFVVLSENPLEKIEAIRGSVFVVKHGRRVETGRAPATAQ